MTHAGPIETLRVRRQSLGGLRWKLFREWCLLRALARRLSFRLALLLGIIGLGGLVFFLNRADAGTGLLDAVYVAFGLIFGDHPAQLPKSFTLRVMHFLLPVLGLGVVLEGIVEMAAVIRDRRMNERSWSTVMAHSLNGHVILVGLGRVGFRIYRTLFRLGIPVVIIDSDDTAEFLAEARRDGSPILIGDARREALLVEAGLAKARALIVATNNDLVNLEVSLDARRRNPDIRVVMRMFDQNMADKVQGGFDIRAVLSTAALAAPTFAAAAIVQDVLSTTVIGSQLLVTVKAVLSETDPWCGCTLAEVTQKHRLNMLGHARAGAEVDVFPPLETRLLAGDELVVQGLYDELIAVSLARP